MRLPIIHSLFAACLAAGLAVVPVAASAADKPAAAPQQTVSKDVLKPLVAAQKALQEKDWATALTHIHEAQAVPVRTPVDDYNINVFLGSAAIGMKDYATAAPVYETLADSPALPADQKVSTLGNALLLSSIANHWANVTRFGEELEAMGPLDEKFSAPLAMAYYNQGDMAKALAVAKRSTDAAAAAHVVAQQQIIDLVLRIQVKQNDLAAASATLETLVTNYSAPEYWAEMIDIAFRTPGLRDIDALDLSRLRLAADATTPESDYQMMARITTDLGYPGECVAMVEHGISKGVVGAGGPIAPLLATARQKEIEDKRSLPSFDAQSRARKTGDYDVKLAETYYGYGRYAEAEEAARRAIAKGGLKDPGEGPLVLGMSLTLQGKGAEAAQVLDQIKATPTEQKIAHLWSLYAQRKSPPATAAAAQ